MFFIFGSIFLHLLPISFLALVLRCLQAAMFLVSDIKKHFRRRLTPQKCLLLLQLDQVQEVREREHALVGTRGRQAITFSAVQDMGSHCREINQKILTIIDDLMARHLSRVRKCRLLSVVSPTSQAPPSPSLCFLFPRFLLVASSFTVSSFPLHHFPLLPFILIKVGG